MMEAEAATAKTSATEAAGESKAVGRKPATERSAHTTTVHLAKQRNSSQDGN
jgi:hypothetical protein